MSQGSVSLLEIGAAIIVGFGPYARTWEHSGPDVVDVGRSGRIRQSKRPGLVTFCNSRFAFKRVCGSGSLAAMGRSFTLRHGSQRFRDFRKLAGLHKKLCAAATELSVGLFEPTADVAVAQRDQIFTTLLVPSSRGGVAATSKKMAPFRSWSRRGGQTFLTTPSAPF